MEYSIEHECTRVYEYVWKWFNRNEDVVLDDDDDFEIALTSK